MAGEHSGMEGYHQHSTAAGLHPNSSATGGYGGGSGYGGTAGSGLSVHAMGGYSSAAPAATMGGSRYNLHHAPLSPGASSYHGGAASSSYHQQHTGPPSVYHGATSYGSRRGSMQSLVAASGMSVGCRRSVFLSPAECSLCLPVPLENLSFAKL